MMLLLLISGRRAGVGPPSWKQRGCEEAKECEGETIKAKIKDYSRI